MPLRQRLAGLPDLIRNAAARHQINLFPPELKSLKAETALLPATAKRRCGSCVEGRRGTCEIVLDSDSTSKSKDGIKYSTAYFLPDMQYHLVFIEKGFRL